VAEKQTPEPQIAPVMVTMTTEQLQALIGSNKGIDADGIKAILDAQANQTRELVNASRQVRHSNPDHEHKSVFSHPEGDLKRPKNKLTHETFLNHSREREEALTPAEIDAYNAIQHPCEARDGTWTVTIKRNQKFINVPSFTTDQRSDLPNGLVLILRELSHGTKGVDPAEMLLRIAALEAQLAKQSQAIEVTG
jgi:hypothetical protein